MMYICLPKTYAIKLDCINYTYRTKYCGYVHSYFYCIVYMGITTIISFNSVYANRSMLTVNHCNTNLDLLIG